MWSASKTMRRHPWWVKTLFYFCVTAVSTVLLACIWRFNHPAAGEESLTDLSVDAQPESVKQGGISGAEVKAHLAGLTEDSMEAVIVAPLCLFADEMEEDKRFLVVPLNMDCTVREVTARGEAYPLSGINYGAVLSERVLKSVSAKGSGLYTQSGFLEEDEVLEFVDTQMVWRRAFHPWDPKTLPIGDDEYFKKETVYGPDSTKIGVFYYPM